MKLKHLMLLTLLALLVLPSCGHKHHGGPTVGSITATIASPAVGQTDVLSITIANTTSTVFTIAWASEPAAEVTFGTPTNTPTSSTVDFTASTAGTYTITVSVTDTNGRASLAQTTLVVTAT